MKFTPRGIYTAIVTPFTKDDTFDEVVFRGLIDFQLDAGVAGLLVIGGSGEYVSLTPSERERVIDVAIEHTAGRAPIIVGALAPGSREVQETARYAAKAGASAVLVLPSYYIKASPDGVYEHFARVAGSAPIPVVAYNNASRTGMTLDVSLLERLATIPSIVALKECERDLAVISAKIRAVGERIAIMSGDDDLGFPTFLLGSPGGIFTTSNLVPAFHRKLFEAAANLQIDVARRAHYALLGLVEAVYTVNHPGPLKDAMTLIGKPVGPARAPLQGGSPKTLRRAKSALNEIASVNFN